jgi:hypothetical protein
MRTRPAACAEGERAKASRTPTRLAQPEIVPLHPTRCVGTRHQTFDVPPADQESSRDVPANLSANARDDNGDFLTKLDESDITPPVAMMKQSRAEAKANDRKGDARRRTARRAGQVGDKLSQRV